MKQYKINLNIETALRVTEDEVCELFNNVVYYIDDKILEKSKLWILDFDLNQTYSIEKQIKFITSHIVENVYHKLLSDEMKISFDIRIYYDTYTCSFNLLNNGIKLFGILADDIELNFSLYPTDFTL